MFREDYIIKGWLMSAGVKNFTINKDLTVDVEGDVVIVKSTMSGYDYLPFKFGKVTGNFSIDVPTLTTLEGCPNVVTQGAFNVFNSRIKNLKGMPKQASYVKISNASELTSLEGFPEDAIIKTIEISICPNLASVKGIPKSATVSNFNFTDCANLQSLEGLPNMIAGFLNLRNSSALKSLRGAPSEISDYLQLTGCFDLENLEHLPHGDPSYEIFVHNSNDFILKNIYYIFMSRNITKVHLGGATSTALFAKLNAVFAIVNMYLKQPYGNKRWIECQSALIDAGFEDYAEVPE
jgi:hypothetical protein